MTFCQQLWVLSAVLFVAGTFLTVFVCQWLRAESAKKNRKGYDGRSHDSYY